MFGEPRRTFRPALEGLNRYIGTTETAKHRIFQFLPVETVPDHMVIAIALSDGFALGVLSSQIHQQWCLRAGGWLGVGNDNRYNKSLVFDPFPFPDPTPAQRAAIADLGEKIDATRKTVQAEQPASTLTGLYNLVEKLRAGTALAPAEAETARAARAGIILELHRRLDAAVAAAYGWDADLVPAEIVARLVALNATRGAEEAAGTIRWLRPDYQAARARPGHATPSPASGRVQFCGYDAGLGGAVSAVLQAVFLTSLPLDSLFEIVRRLHCPRRRVWRTRAQKSQKSPTMRL